MLTFTSLITITAPSLAAACDTMTEMTASLSEAIDAHNLPDGCAVKKGPLLAAAEPPSIQSLVTDPLELLRACVVAKNAFWDAFALFEKQIAPDGFSDHANDRVVDLIDDLCVSAGCPPLDITAEHLAMAIRRAHQGEQP